MASKHKQRGFWGAILPAAASIIGGVLASDSQKDTNDQNAQINSAQQAFNAEEAVKNREFQSTMRSTQYQTAVGDLKMAGLNPMLAYTNGGAGTPSGSQATSGSMIPMQNTGQTGINGAVAAAQIANTHSQTEVNEAQADKIRAETPLAVANTGAVNQHTTNMKAELNNIQARLGEITEHKDLMMKQGWTQTEMGNLLRAQTDVAKIEQQLKSANITFTEAQTMIARIVARLKGLEIPKAENEAAYEGSDYRQNTRGGVQNLKEIINLLNPLAGTAR